MICGQAQMDAVHDVLDTKVNEKPFEDTHPKRTRLGHGADHAWPHQAWQKRAETPWDGVLPLDWAVTTRGYLILVAIAWACGLPLGCDEDLKHCTASLTRGVVKFAQAEGVLKWQNIKRGMLENPPVNESQCYTQT